MSVMRIPGSATAIPDAVMRPIMSGRNPRGDEVGVCGHCLLWNGRPWFPVMGEFHYSRYPRKLWDESILKIQAGGVGIISTYVFWIHHEEVEGDFDWSGDRDLRHFLSLCAVRGSLVLLRIGPWSHGECRNGGFPDWLLRKGFALRTNDEGYLVRVRRLFEEIHHQAQGFLFRDGGPIMGIQLENEYGHVGGLKGPEGEAHMLALKRLARDVGFDVPLYTATGWGGAVVVRGEYVPVMSAYADAPWTQHSDPLPPNGNYKFSVDRNDTQVGSDLAGVTSAPPVAFWEGQPYLMAELGAGIMATGHRRPVVTARDSEAMVLVRLGSGANLLGYYMFHGGSNPVGRLSTLQESRATGYPNDLPVISYDFQAAIGEFGRISNTYRSLKILHLFLRDFGHRMAGTRAIIPAQDLQARCALRVADAEGFLFVNNHQRGYPLPSRSGVRFVLETADGEVTFPQFDLAEGRSLIFPFNLRIAGFRILSATAQLLCQVEADGLTCLFFFSYPEIPPVYQFEARSVLAIEAHGPSVERRDAAITVSAVIAGTGSSFRVQGETGQCTTLMTLTREQAETCWRGRAFGRERVFLSSADLQFADDRVRLQSSRHGSLDFSVFPAVGFPDPGFPWKSSPDGLFRRYERSDRRPAVELELPVTPVPRTAVDLAEWDIPVPPDADGLFLCIDFSGDRAELVIGGAVAADCFSTGLVWEIGLSRFAPLPASPSRLRVHGLREGARVFFDRKPRFRDGLALELRRVWAWRQQSVIF